MLQKQRLCPAKGGVRAARAEATDTGVELGGQHGQRFAEEVLDGATVNDHGAEEAELLVLAQERDAAAAELAPKAAGGAPSIA